MRVDPAVVAVVAPEPDAAVVAELDALLLLEPHADNASAIADTEAVTAIALFLWAICPSLVMDATVIITSGLTRKQILLKNVLINGF